MALTHRHVLLLLPCPAPWCCTRLTWRVCCPRPCNLVNLVPFTLLLLLHSVLHRYVQQGLRAVNQAMGRVIRHRWDYGAVLLADERFGSQQNLRNMSRWLRDQVVTHGNFGSAIGSLTKFFKVGGQV